MSSTKITIKIETQMDAKQSMWMGGLTPLSTAESSSRATPPVNRSVFKEVCITERGSRVSAGFSVGLADIMP